METLRFIVGSARQKLKGMVMRNRKTIVVASIACIAMLVLLNEMFNIGLEASFAQIIWMNISVIVTVALMGTTYWLWRLFLTPTFWGRRVLWGLATLLLAAVSFGAIYVSLGGSWVGRASVMLEGNLYNGGQVGLLVLMFVGAMIAAWLWGHIKAPEVSVPAKVKKPKATNVERAERLSEPEPVYRPATATPVFTSDDANGFKHHDWSTSIPNVG